GRARGDLREPLPVHRLREHRQRDPARGGACGMTSIAASRYVGRSVTRVEDQRILTGTGRYIDDIVLPGMLHGVFVRSPLPHARIVSIDAEHARSMPGVVAVITAADLKGTVRPLQFPMEVPTYLRPVFHALASDKVR